MLKTQKKDLGELVKELADFYGIELREKTSEELASNVDVINEDNLYMFGLKRRVWY